MKLVIVGPSHVTRWESNIRKGAAPLPSADTVLLGIAGAPIWSKTLWNQVAQAFVPGQSRLILLVGDTRLGNAICRSAADHEMDYPFADGFTLIDSSFIDVANDHAMAARVEDAIGRYCATYGEAVRVIYWDMIGRRNGDMLMRRHMESGNFFHPSWGAAFPGAHRGTEVVPLQDLFRYPLGEIARLYIDEGNHPSAIGYLFLHYLLQGRFDVKQAFDRARSVIEAALLDAFSLVSEGGQMLVAGNSIWIDTLRRTLGLSGQNRLATAGTTIHVTANGRGGVPGLPQDPERFSQFLFISHEGSLKEFLINNPPLAQFLRQRGAETAITYIPWESCVAAACGDGLLQSARPVSAVSRDDIVRIWDQDGADFSKLFEEYGNRGEPNWSGLTTAIRLARGAKVVSADLAVDDNAPEPMTWAMENGVMVTSRDWAFLIEGGHRVVDYITGRLAPTPASLDAFAANITSRAEIARAHGADYLHVIFPDKQSVLRKEFPLRPLHCLGQQYLEHTQNGYGAAPVLYPVAQLRTAVHPVFCRYDTHMTDHGSLLVLRQILDRLELPAQAMLDLIGACIDRRTEQPGDLGSKLTPARQESLRQLAPTWRVDAFHGFTQANDGAIDILLSPNAALRKTVVIFGDSFFRRMLAMLSGIFMRVICLRTRFLHPEMVALIRPDIVLTGNVERYLGNVQLDCEAHAFMLYPFLKDPPQTAVDPGFMEALRALTSPSSTQSRAFFERHENG